MTPRLYIGTAGLSVWYSDDLGETLQRFWGTSGMYSETRVWALAAHPERPGELLAGTDSGIYRLDIASGKWTHLPSRDGRPVHLVGRALAARSRPDPRRDAPAGHLPLDRRRENLGARQGAAAGDLPGRDEAARDADHRSIRTIRTSSSRGSKSAACGARPTAAGRSRTPRPGWYPKTSTTSRSCATARAWSTPPPTWACM